ncbi:non-heme bromoperoxidase BpoC [Sphaerisporangium siamense]|uniref:Pimeloyl-ACP methyl ester carboxylesterase n=1 Tax=Sphaerisporangium siamense TaxID=795645 RepID=A0A7W7D313_9ACTN|nr:alpha/beta hydrolase [Sphaerisporangium siamense]MBB4699389.1 pimeloyl-ACP methyl ester carboxylesterase [Sphaerisporangium siamense]GII89608.1 non-heme bromoperoxidase BpoC [Sphaerisporangium siamense]
MLAGVAGAGVAALAPSAAFAAAERARGGKPGGRETVLPAQTSWGPVPAMTGRKQVQIPDVKLAVWDTGDARRGKGQAVVLMHPHTGNGGSWGYQQAAFAAAGYRVISYSRRGYHGSEAGPAERPGTVVGDLVALMDALGVGKFHLVGLAAGAFAAFDAGLSVPDRLLSCTVGSTLAGIQEPAWNEGTTAILPPGWAALPETFRELGPSYRAAKPAAMTQWTEQAQLPVTTVQQPPQNALMWPAIESIRTPMLLLTGDCDLYLPPTRLREMARHVRNAEVAIFSEAGHAPHWESYRAFNETVLSFLGEHRR